MLAALALLAPLAHAAPDAESVEVAASESIAASATTEERVDPHRVGLGTRAGVWYGGAGAPMLGGHISLRPDRNLRLILFSDNAAKGLDTLMQVDHVIGFHAIVPMVRWKDGIVGAALGSCVDFRTWRDRKDLSMLRADVLFGPRAGIHVEHDIDAAWSLQGTTTAALYVGNTESTYGWGGRTDGLEASAIVQAQVGVTRWW